MRRKNGQFERGTHWRKPQPWWDAVWLTARYVDEKRSASEIASEFGSTENNILFWLKKHGITRRTMAEVRAVKRWGQDGADNPMWNRRGELNPRWLGGVTPRRQAFYASEEWKRACSTVWERDAATCRRCGLIRETAPDMPMHVHHIVSFADEALRADADNLVLLCEACHQFVHSRRNVDGEYIQKK